MTARRYRTMPLALLALLGAALACNAPVPGIAPTRIPVSTEALGELIQNLGSITPAADGSVTITMTQEQLTSLVALELAKNPEVPVENPQVALDNGEADFTGTLEVQGLKAKAEVKMNVAVDADGKPDIAIVSAKFGPLPLPDNFLKGIPTALSDALVAQVEKQAGVKIKITSITIDDGVMTVKGMAVK